MSCGRRSPRRGARSHSDTIDPQWNVFDLCPEGRGTDWNPALSYANAPPRCCG